MKWVTRTTVTPRARMSSIELPRVAAGLRVEAGRQLVEDRDPRVADEGQRDRQALLLTAGQMPELRLSRFSARPRPSSSAPMSAGFAVEGGVQLQRLADAQLGRQLALLELDADLFAQLVAIVTRVEAEHADRARVRLAEAADGLDGRGLAGAVRAEDREDLALLDAENEMSSTATWSP